MKKLILAAITTACAASVFAQGIVSFSNRSAGGTTHIWVGGTQQIQGNSASDSPGGGVDYAGAGLHLVGTLPGGATEASHIFSQLLGAPGSGVAESSLLPGLGITTFRTGAASGNVVLTTATFSNFADNAPVGTFEMVAWDNSSGAYPTWTQASSAWQAGFIMGGRSAEFVLQAIGGSINTNPNINPSVGSFNIFLVPEPTTVALAGLGAAAMLIFRRRK